MRNDHKHVLMTCPMPLLILLHFREWIWLPHARSSTRRTKARHERPAQVWSKLLAVLGLGLTLMGRGFVDQAEMGSRVVGASCN